MVLPGLSWVKIKPSTEEARKRYREPIPHKTHFLTPEPLRILVFEPELGRPGLEPLLHILDLFGRRDVFGHGAANPLDGLPHLRSDLTMRVDRLLLVLDTFLGELLAGLRHAELVGRQ